MPKKKKSYTVVMSIDAASGSRSYVVEADSPEDAKRIVSTGDIECEHEEIEVERVAPIEDWEVFDAEGKRIAD